MNDPTAETIAFGQAVADVDRAAQRAQERAAPILRAARTQETVDEWLDGLGRVRFNAPFWEGDTPTDEWTLEMIVPKGRSVSLSARAGTGKSLLTVWACTQKVTGQRGLGGVASSPTAGTILYCDYEMTPADLRERLESMGLGPETDLTRLHYLSLPALAPLNSPEGGQQLLAVAKAVDAEVVIIDTFSRAAPGIENDAATAQDYYRYTGLLLKQAGIASLRLDHLGKETGRGARGSSAKADDVDVSWVVTVLSNKSETIGGTVVTKRFKLVADKQRVDWVTPELELYQLAEPLAFRLATEPGWPAGTKEVADLLDRLHVPLDATAKVASAALRAADAPKRKGVVLSSLKFRRLALDQKIGHESSGTTTGTAQTDIAGTIAGTEKRKRHSTSTGTAAGTAGTNRPPETPGVPTHMWEPGLGTLLDEEIL
jgi:AAA domain